MSQVTYATVIPVKQTALGTHTDILINTQAAMFLRSGTKPTMVKQSKFQNYNAVKICGKCDRIYSSGAQIQILHSVTEFVSKHYNAFSLSLKFYFYNVK